MKEHIPTPVSGPWLTGDGQACDKLLAALLVAGNERERKRLYALLTAAFEPDALKQALARADRPALSRAVGLAIGRKSRRAERWIHATLRDLGAWTGRDAWSVSALSDNAVLYRTGGDPARKTLVAGFTGRSHWLMLPTYKVLKALGEDGYDLLLLRDPLDRFYQQGIPGHGADPVETAEALAGWSRKEGYRRTVAIGTSAGHLMALFATLHNRWPHAMLVGGTDPSRCPVFAALFERMRQEPSTSLHLCFAADHAENSRAARILGAQFAQARLFPHAGASQHNLLEEIDETGDAVAYIRLHLTRPEAA